MLCACGCGSPTTIASQNHAKYGWFYGQPKKFVRGHRMKKARKPYPFPREHQSWAHAKSRCFNPNVPKFPIYGGRGITMCKKWRDSFSAFLADMGPCPAGMTLDRYPNQNGNYEPGNCRWATPMEQGRNRRTVKLTVDKAQEIRSLAGVITQPKVAEMFGVSTATIKSVQGGRIWKPDVMRGEFLANI